MPDHDYSSPGIYFLTQCTYRRQPLFGEIIDGIMYLNDRGVIVAGEWLRSVEIRTMLQLDEWIIMPDHMHGIVMIGDEGRSGDGCRGDLQVAPTRRPNGPPPGSIGALMAGFKSAATKRMNLADGTPGRPIWQRNYWDRIIRNEQELENVRRYIRENPRRWGGAP